MSERAVLSADDVSRTLVRIAHEIIEKNAATGAHGADAHGGSAGDDSRLAVVGIHTRGTILARRLHAQLEELTGERLPLGDLDISFYRDDLPGREPADSPVVHASHLDFDPDGMTIVLVDDVLFTGRTVRAAIDALFDYGRPRKVQLAVLVDRGHRELPIRPDYTGKNLPTARDERVNVRLAETDGGEDVTISSLEMAGGTA